MAQNIINNVVENHINNTAQVNNKMLSDSKNNTVSEELNTVNEVMNSNEFFRVSTYQCTPPKH